MTPASLMWLHSRHCGVPPYPVHHNHPGPHRSNISSLKISSQRRILPAAAEEVQPVQSQCFYTAIIEFILTCSLTIWYTTSTKKEGPAQFQDPEANSKDYRFHLDRNFFKNSPLAIAWAPSEPKPHATRTASP